MRSYSLVFNIYLVKKWRADYEMPFDDFNDLALKEYKKIEPIYKELHAYVRYRLSKVFGEDIVDNDGGLSCFDAKNIISHLNSKGLRDFN